VELGVELGTELGTGHWALGICDVDVVVDVAV